MLKAGRLQRIIPGTVEVVDGGLCPFFWPFEAKAARKIYADFRSLLVIGWRNRNRLSSRSERPRRNGA